MPASTAPARARLGREVPRVWTPPLRPLTRKTSAGFECIDFAEQVLEIRLFPWQKWLLIHALELLEDGSFRFRTVVVMVARQNGKSTLMQVLSLWRMFVDGAPLIIGTAQNLDVAEEQWQGAVDMAESVPELDAELESVTKVNGKKQIRLQTGERYKVAAASRKGGRGLSGDLVLMDELREHKNWESWGAVTKTTMARLRAQVWAASNAGDRASVVLDYLRKMAHAALGNPDELDVDVLSVDPDATGADTDDLPGIFEWSATPGCSIWDRDGWEQANPSLGHPDGISERAIASAARTDPEAVFRTEVLCQWVDDVLSDRIIPQEEWDARLDKNPERGAPTYALAGLDGPNAAASIGASDGLNVSIIEWHRGLVWLPAKLSEVLAERPGRVLLDPRSPIGALISDLDVLGIDWDPITGTEHAQACVGFLNAVLEGTGVAHSDQPVLNVAVAGAKSRPYGESWVWSQRHADIDISPLDAVTIARWAALQTESSGPADFFTI